MKIKNTHVYLIFIIFALGCIFWFSDFAAEKSAILLDPRLNSVSKSSENSPVIPAPTLASISAMHRGRQPALDSMIARATDKIGATSAAFLISFDPHYLNLLKEFPDSSLLLASFEGDSQARLGCARNLNRVDGLNTVGLLIEATLQSQSGKAQLSKEAWEKAIEVNKIDLKQQEIKGHIHAAWKDLGFDETTAIQLTLKNTFAYGLSSTIQDAADKIWKMHRSNASSSEDLIDAASQQLLFINMLKRSRQPDLRMSIETLGIENEILKTLPADVEFGSENFSVSDRLGKINEEQKNLGKQLEQFGRLFQNSSPSDISRFEMIRFLQGEQAARQWLISVSVK